VTAALQAIDGQLYRIDYKKVKNHITVTGRQGKGTRGDQCIIVKTIVVAQGKERKNECGKETIYSGGRLAKG
jgi:hypothetical protein